MNSDQLNVWLTNVMQEPLPEWVRLGAQDIADEVKRQWGDKARRRAEDRYNGGKQTCRASATYETSIELIVRWCSQKSILEKTCEEMMGQEAVMQFSLNTPDTNWLFARRWSHDCQSGFDIVLDDAPAYEVYSGRWRIHAQLCDLRYDIDQHLGLDQMLTGLDSDHGDVLKQLLDRWMYRPMQHVMVDDADGFGGLLVKRCVFCSGIRVKKPNKNAHYWIDNHGQVNVIASRPPCKFVRPSTHALANNQLDLALQIATDDNFTISSLK